MNAHGYAAMPDSGMTNGSSGLKRDAWSAAERAEPAARSSGVVTLGPTRASVG